ncbi:hypothetical protein Acr_05g0013810 [Actinidia rufa]|uniref:Uncharacterized protein n=1 Tax=Actinidia rufa TaxID=165716 RepID=A0A7J0EN52_9ERIC|nr:hypothetical protein Acr_05g0013810 [Actinidia rufa]
MSKRMDVKKLAYGQGGKGQSTTCWRRGAQRRGETGEESKGIHDAPLEVSPKKKSPTKRVTTLVKSGIPPSTPLSPIKDSAVATKLAQFVLLPANMEMADKMELDEVVGMLLNSTMHTPRSALVLGSSLVGRVKEMREGVETKEVTILSLKGEVEQPHREALIYQKRVAELKS